MKTIRSKFVFLTIWLVFGGSVEARERPFSDGDRAWWAIQPVVDPAVPDAGTNVHPIDAFVIRKRAAADLDAAPAAVPREFIRRIFFDLHGLPPAPEEVEAFVAAWEIDFRAAISSITDELLASPRYGERWAQHWLDVVRYSESDGYREDRFRPGAHRYRDYVVRSLNEDKPYDQFVREQLAADEMAPGDPSSVEATGFLRLGVYEWNQRDAEGQREIMINEITDLTGEVFLGIGIGCARCHDHKFDPLLQRDYFALQAFLASTFWPDDRRIADSEQLANLADWKDATHDIRSEIDALLEAPRGKTADIAINRFPENVQRMVRKPAGEKTSYERQISLLVHRQVERDIEKLDVEKSLSKDAGKIERYRQLVAQLDGAKPEEPEIPTAFISTDTGSQPAVVAMGSGGDRVEIQPAFPALLEAEAPSIAPTSTTTGRRSALAGWIASTQNPFAARVIVNRIWQYHFGTGLVATPNDFGTLGDPPSHPELLDWLTTRFVEGGWKMKPLHRLILSSETYRMTARREPGGRENTSDPKNRLLWRFPPQRLSAEQVRDAMLAVSGEIRHRDTGGPSAESSTPVRSIYLKKHRNTPDPFLHSFDAPTGFDSAPVRQKTTTPSQALLIANHGWPMERARAFTKRILGNQTEITAVEITRAYQLALGRGAGRDEVGAALEFIRDQAVELARKLPPPSPASKYPDETGLRPIDQNFSKIAGRAGMLGDSALWLQPGSRFEQLVLPVEGLGGDEFTINAVAQLDRIHKDASVNTLVSRWSGEHSSAGWSLGVTSEESRFGPRNLVVQLVGTNPGGDTEYEVVASGLHVPTGAPFVASATIEPGRVTFGLDGESSTIDHNLVGGFNDLKTRLIVGGRDTSAPAHLWDGQLARLKIANILDVTFNQGGLPPETAWRKNAPPPVEPADPEREAFADFCHALLGSNEFIYLH